MILIYFFLMAPGVIMKAMKTISVKNINAYPRAKVDNLGKLVINLKSKFSKMLKLKIMSLTRQL